MPAKNESWDWREGKQKVSMAEKAGKSLDSLRETACLNIEERETIAYMKMYIDLFKDDTSKENTEFIEFLNVVIPAFRNLGHARWYRDVITDLGLALSGTKRENKHRKSAKNVLSE